MIRWRHPVFQTPEWRKSVIDNWVQDQRDAELRDFWIQSLCDQVSWIPRARRAGCRWRMNLRTLNLVRSVTIPAGGYLSGRYLNAGAWPAEPEILLGFPVDIDEDAVGAVLVEAA